MNKLNFVQSYANPKVVVMIQVQDVIIVQQTG